MTPSQSTDDLVKQIDEAVARFPIRAEGVYWLHADEWGLLKDTIERLQRELKLALKSADQMKACWNAACHDIAERDGWLAARDKTIETLVGVADRVLVKYGNDWTEWRDLQDAIDAARSEEKP